MRLVATLLLLSALVPGEGAAQESLLALRGSAGELDALALALSAEIVYSETKLGKRERIYRIDESDAVFLERAAADRHYFYSYQGLECWKLDCRSGPVTFSVFGDGTLTDTELQERVESLGGVLLGQMRIQFGNFRAPVELVQGIEAGDGVHAIQVTLPEPAVGQHIPRVLSLGAGKRFAAIANFTIGQGPPQSARALPVSRDSGGFVFFDPDNVELDVKVLDGCGVNGHFWVFVAGLTDLPVQLQLADQENGSTRRYISKGGPFELIRDVVAFPCTN